MRRYFYAPILLCITISASAHSGSNTAFDERSCLLSAERSYSEALMLGDTTKTITGVVMEEAWHSRTICVCVIIFKERFHAYRR